MTVHNARKRKLNFVVPFYGVEVTHLTISNLAFKTYEFCFAAQTELFPNRTLK